MVEISNIDAIIELILREARGRKGPSLVVKIYNVHNEIDRRLGEAMEKYSNEERRKNKDENKG
ncbi:hypothetical protein ES702_05018 [subsurface metagenome]